MTTRNAITSVPIIPVLAERWSPRSMDETHVLSESDLTSILEAGRWAPSAMNGQPWRYSAALRGGELFETVRGKLSGFNADWTKRASAYVVVSALDVTADGSKYVTADLDAGLSVAQMIIQAQGIGLVGHIMTGIDFTGLHEVLALADELRVVCVVAIGKGAPADRLEGGAYERETAPRARHSLDEIVLHRA